MDETYEIHILKASFLSIKNYIYVIVDKVTREAAIIDPSWDIMGIVDLLGDIDARLTTILLTHSHFDHVNLVKSLLKEFYPRVYMSAEEISFYGFNCPNLKPFHHLDTISLGHTDITFISTPGHTAGGACFLLSGSIFTGDTIFIEGCGICSSKGGGSPEKMFKSIQYLKRILNPTAFVYPAHSYGKQPGYPFSYLLENNIYFLIDKKDMFINFRMRKNQKKLFDFK
jgi:hydroxyacylglutathione hydrolase